MSFEDRLRHELQQAGETIPVIGADLDQTMSRGRKIRQHTVALVAAAAAVVVALAVGGAAVLTRTTALGPEPQPPVGGTEGSVGPERTDAPNRVRTPTPENPASPAPGLDEVEPVLREWLSAIRDGNADGAWDLMTPRAQESVGRATFDDMMASALREGLGAFADAPSVSVVEAPSEGAEGRAIAVVSGEVTREATSEFAAIAIPMSVEADGTLVDDPLVGRDRYWERVAVFASASLGPQQFRAGDELNVELTNPEGATDAFISVDDASEPLATEFDESTGVATATLDRDLAAGRHIATVIVLHRSGRLYPEPIIFEAAAP